MAKAAAEDDKKQQQADEYREVLSNAYAFIEGQKSNQSFAALTPEDCMDRFVERIEGKDTEARPNVLNRVTKIKNQVMAAVEKIKLLPADAFRRQSDKTDVNTDPEPPEDDLYSDMVVSEAEGTTV